ncbi:MAG: glycoside hydrolase domain-containing protein [Terriglobus sp.]
MYIQSATLNGKPLNTFWIKHSDVTNGGELTFNMGSQPNKSWPSETALPK